MVALATTLQRFAFVRFPLDGAAVRWQLLKCLTGNRSSCGCCLFIRQRYTRNKAIVKIYEEKRLRAGNVTERLLCPTQWDFYNEGYC